MAYISKKQAVISSILDRLIDEEPEKLREPIKSRHQQLNELYQSVRRDLESLLNTRISGINWPAEWHELNTSVLSYGIADFMGDSLGDASTQQTFCKKLAEIIKRFEPRFKQVEVQLLQGEKQQDRTLRMRIEGLLYAEPVPEPIVYDSVLEPETNHFLII